MDSPNWNDLQFSLSLIKINYPLGQIIVKLSYILGTKM